MNDVGPTSLPEGTISAYQNIVEESKMSRSSYEVVEGTFLFARYYLERLV